MMLAEDRMRPWLKLGKICGEICYGHVALLLNLGRANILHGLTHCLGMLHNVGTFEAPSYKADIKMC